MNKHKKHRVSLAALSAALLMASAGAAHADEKRELEQLRATTVALIEALVNQGLLTRERADSLLRQAQSSAAANAPAGEGPAAGTWGAPIAGAAAGATVGSKVIRVPYVSESLRQQMREEIKNDVLITAREEGWADSRAIPEWVKGVKVEGDVRVRWQNERYPQPGYANDATTGLPIGVPCLNVSGNLPAECYRSQTSSPAWAPDLTNTTNDRNRLTLRARLGVTAKVSDDIETGLRLSTGNTSGPTSSSQTLGTFFNKSAVVLDRAYIRWEPHNNLRLVAGRMANPFYGSDLLWPEDIGFDGVALQGDLNLANGVFGFATAGVFPLEEFNSAARNKWLSGLQAGVDMSLGNSTQLRTAFAAYQFNNVEGQRATDLPLSSSNPRAATQNYLSSQYPTTVRLKGNTLINLCPLSSENNATVAAPCTNGGPVWGLAAKFAPINWTTGVVFKQWDPVELAVNFDWVRNSGFDLTDIRNRAGTSAVDALAAKTTGVQLRFALGRPKMANKGDWNVFAALRHFERDAWLDGFTDTTWNLGGTNYKGWQLGGAYAIDRHSTLGLRLTSTRNLDDGVRTTVTSSTGVTAVSGDLSSATYKVDVLQLDLNTRF
ncbi:putative porin [Roseateles koreensis]|uniref:Porin n=1 Tax=Roseateles koreensis TaxID=2987526 RepID=A0ABT5KQH9_9BURK|nr:putative porin [Roseateles koreensis]MDC8784042.1 putative porin [Roseateles koreensis]